MEKITLETAKTGSELVLETLRDLGIDTIFGYPGGAVLPLYDAIYSFEGIQHILGRHEQGCLHEAEGYAKSTGKLGVAVVTSGPGATNAITGIADAMSDSVPLLVFTGQVNRAGIGKDAFQEADIVGITMPITKYNYQVRETADIPRIITEAVHIATTGRPGPVVIDLPKDVSALETDFIYEPSVKLPSYQPTIEPNELQIKKILKQLSKAKKPVLLAGGGVSYAGAAKELIAFAERYQIPVVTSLLGQGTIATSHPLFLGMGGMHGSFAANIAMTETDFMISVGCRFDDRLTGNPKTFAKNAKVAHIDIDPAEIGKIIAVDNYFVEREQTPIDENGDYNYEDLHAVDIELFNKHMTRLLNGEKVELPEFNFKFGRKEYNGNFLQLGEEDVLVIEGIHCLNDELSYSLPIDSKFKIYISALTQLNVDEHNRVSTTDGRLLRRLVRDYRTRGASAKKTLSMWESVRRGEEKNIFPFQEQADVMFNSAMPYEPCVLKPFVEPILFQVTEADPEYQEANRLLKFMNYFLPCGYENVPIDSILREFVGGGCFKV